MRISKKMKLVFCLLISIFLTSQITAAQYFLICTENGLKIYFLTDKKNWSKLDNPIEPLLDKNSKIISAGFNSDGTILYTQIFNFLEDSPRTTINFYKVSDYGDKICFTKLTPQIVQPSEVWACGFNPIDGTFYICSNSGRHGLVAFYKVKDASVEQLTHKIAPGRHIYSFIFCPKDPTTVFALRGPGVYLYSLTSDGSLLNNDLKLNSGSFLTQTDGRAKGGFSPSGNVFFTVSGPGRTPKIVFYKGQHKKCMHGVDLGDIKFGELRNNHVYYKDGGFIDNEHFFICTRKGVTIYSIPDCDKWQLGTIGDKAFVEIETLEPELDCFAAVLSPVYHKNEAEFKNNLKELSTNQDKAKKAHSDVRIHF